MKWSWNVNIACIGHKSERKRTSYAETIESPLASCGKRDHANTCRKKIQYCKGNSIFDENDMLAGDRELQKV